ncbi:TRAP transporter substrate-binding protein DctP [Ruicaihuangia caeni]|uniref:TRAP transporter substrate-binding protein DctP n=1 Tax=Ruicaihuangia caeni TaxID=3042517 RepID=UPI00338DB68A
MKTRPTRAAALGAVAVSALLVAGCAQGTPEAPAEEEFEPITISVAHTMLDANPANQIVLEVAERVKERTDGNIILEVFPASQLGNTTETTEQASLGQAVISYLDAATASTYGVDEFGMLGAPFLVSDYDEVERVVSSDLFTGWTDELAESANLRILALNWLAGPRNIVGPKPYTTPDALEGTKIRIPPLPTWEALFGTALAATPVTVNASELYTAMQQGVVDAAELDTPSIRDYGLFELQKHVTLTGHFNLFMGFAMPEDLFQSLPVEYQEVLLDEFLKGGKEATDLATDLAAEARTEMEAAGVTFHQGDVAAYRKASKAFYDAFPDWDSAVVDELLAIRDGK